MSTSSLSIIHWNALPLNEDQGVTDFEVRQIIENLMNPPDLFLFYHLNGEQTKLLTDKFSHDEYSIVSTGVPIQEGKNIGIDKSYKFPDRFYGAAVNTNKFTLQEFTRIYLGAHEKIHGLFESKTKTNKLTFEFFSSPLPTSVYAPKVKPTPFSSHVTIFASIQGVNEAWASCLASIRRPYFSNPPIVCTTTKIEEVKGEIEPKIAQDQKTLKTEEVKKKIEPKIVQIKEPFCIFLASQTSSTHRIECGSTSSPSFASQKNPPTSIRPPTELSLNFSLGGGRTADLYKKVNSLASFVYDPWK